MKQTLYALLFLLFVDPYGGAPALAHGDVHEQIVELSRRLRADPRNAELYHKRGELHRAHGEYDAALADYTRAERLAPSLAVVHLSRGRALLESARLGPAVRALSTFLEREPPSAEAHLLRARALAQLKRHAEAELDFAAALAGMDDPGPDPFLERAQNLAESGREQEALAVLESGLARLGSLITLENAALDLELRLGPIEPALARPERLLQSTQRRETLLARKATLLERAGRKEDAKRTRREALAALESLPPPKRALKHTQALERELRAALGDEGADSQAR